MIPPLRVLKTSMQCLLLSSLLTVHAEDGHRLTVHDLEAMFAGQNEASIAMASGYVLGTLETFSSPAGNDELREMYPICVPKNLTNADLVFGVMTRIRSKMTHENERMEAHNAIVGAATSIFPCQTEPDNAPPKKGQRDT